MRIVDAQIHIWAAETPGRPWPKRAEPHRAPLGKDELLAADQRLRAVTPKGPRGPLAVVADRQRGELAQIFKALAADDRPVEIFPSIHEARKWLATFPVTM